MKKSTETETKAHTPVMVSMKRLTNLRQRRREFMRSPIPPPALGSSHNQQASEPVENERQKKEYESQLNKGLIMQIAGSFGELVGDNGGDRITGREERGANHRRVADDHGDGHGFAEGAREGQENGAHDAGTGKGYDDLPS